MSLWWVVGITLWVVASPFVGSALGRYLRHLDDQAEARGPERRAWP